MPLHAEEEQSNELTEQDFFDELLLILICYESCMHSLSYLVKLHSFK